MKVFNRVTSFSDLITLKSDRFNRRNSSFKEFRRVIFRRTPDIRRDYYESFYEYSNGADDIDFDFNENITCNRAIERFKYYKNIEYYDLGLKITHHKSVRNYDDKRRKFYKNGRIVRYIDGGLVPKIQLPSYTDISNVEFEFESWKHPSMQLTNQYLSTYAKGEIPILTAKVPTFNLTKPYQTVTVSPLYSPALSMQNLNKRRK